VSELLKGGRCSSALAISYSRAFYYLTFRVNERKAVFKSTRARETFLEYLASTHTTMRWCMRTYFIFGAKESHTWSSWPTASACTIFPPNSNTLFQYNCS